MTGGNFGPGGLGCGWKICCGEKKKCLFLNVSYYV
jgi:hypothetical protein